MKQQVLISNGVQLVKCCLSKLEEKILLKLEKL